MTKSNRFPPGWSSCGRREVLAKGNSFMRNHVPAEEMDKAKQNIDASLTSPTQKLIWS